MPKKQNSLVGVAGEYYVCAELARRGYIAVLAPKNNPLFDIVATNQEGTHSVSIQVKTRAADNKERWKFGMDMEKKYNNSELFVVLVALNDDDTQDYYVYQHDVLSDRVVEEYRDYVADPKKNGEPKKDPGFRWYESQSLIDYKDRKNDWSLIMDKLN
jgi:hypothetical protein